MVTKCLTVKYLKRMRKSKVLLSAGALLALFAACNNELEMPANIEAGIANRPSAGKVVVTPVVGDDTDTRAEWTGTRWLWQPNDRFGVMLMDEWNQTNEYEDPVDNYKFTDYIHTNYPFSTKDGYLWSSPDNAAVCEGNYFFVYPYNASYKQRGFVGFHVPNKQTQQDPTDPSTPVRDYQKYMGYAFIPAANEDVNNVDVAFHPIFAAPKFKLQNISGMSLRLIKLVVRTHQHGLDGSPLLMPDSLVLAPLSRNFAEKASKYPEMSLGSTGDQTAYLFSHATLVQNGFYAQESANGSKIASNSQDGVYEYTLDFGSDYIVENGEFFRACLVMPAGEYGNFDVFAFIEEQNSEKTTGVVKFTATVNSHWTGMDTQNGAMQTLLKPGHTQVFSASFDSQAIQNLGVKDFTVVSSEDLAWIINLKAKKGGNDKVVIKTLGDEVELNKEVYALMSDWERENIKWQIDGTIVIPEDVPENAIDLLTTGEEVKTTIINKGEQKLTKNLVNCDVVNYGSIKEGEKVAITIDGNVIVKAGEVVVSTVDGDLTVEAGATATVGLVTGTITNNGTVTVSNVQGDVNNYGTATIGNAEDKKDKKIINYTSGIMSLIGNKYAGHVANYGTMTIDEATEFTYKGATDDSTPALYNEGTLTFNKDVTVSDVDITFVNNISNPEIEATVAKNVSVIFSRIYNNAGTLTIEAGAKVTSYKNLADKIVNEAGATINNNGTLHNVLNRGMIVTGSGSDTVVTGGNGTIDNSAIADVVYNEDQTCLYKVEDVTNMTFDELQENVNNADANRLEIVAGTLTLETNSTLKGRVAHETTGYFAKGVDFGTVTIAGKNLLIIYTDQMTISDDETYIDQSELVIMKTGSAGTTLTIKEGARLDISNNAILRGGQNAKLMVVLEGNVHNNGTVKYIANPNDCKTESDNHWTGNAAEE